MDVILVLNGGSSSIKFAVFAPQPAGDFQKRVLHGHVARLGADIELLVRDAKGDVLARTQHASQQDLFDHDVALQALMAWLDTHRAGLTLVAVGHRVVHGGLAYVAPVLVDDTVLAALTELIPLAPLHQPHNLKAIALMHARWPLLPQVACFDTAFHANQPAVAKTFALPRALTAAGIRRYGFHGLSYEFIASQLSRVLADNNRGKVIVAHLGSGASLCALQDGKSIATSMGFSALDGLVMGTRCGALDPGVVLYLQQEKHMRPEQISTLLYTQSGLLGVSGISSDMQTLLASTEPHAAEAIDLFIYRIAGEIGALAAALGGLDALIFTAGIGENAPQIRQRVVTACAWLGAKLDVAANDANADIIHASDSRLAIAVIPTDEEHMIALHTRQIAR